jgi:phosphatidylglycerol lysyltransferase
LSDTGEPIFENNGLLRSLLLFKLKPLWPWIALTLLTWIGWREIHAIQIGVVRDFLRGTGANLFVALLGITTLNLSVAGLYDVVALGPRSRPPGFATRWSVGILSFAWSNFLTVGPLAGPALRTWLYRERGVPFDRAKSALTAILSAFSLSLLAWCAVAALPLPAGIDSVAVRLGLALPAGAALVAALRGARAWSLLPGTIREWEGPPALLAAVAMVDWLLAWVVFHATVDGFHGGIDPLVSLRAFFLGQLVGLVSLIPGGLGSADAFWLHSLSSVAGERNRLAAALLVYRVVYYVIPWAFATLTLAGHLLRTGRRLGAFVRSAIASYAFVCGAVLLASAATPALSSRAALLHRTIPLAVVEVSHGTSVILGFLLLVISRGLARGYRSSHRAAIALFLSASVATFLKGLDFEEALLALAAVAALLVFRSAFQRGGRLHPSTEFVVSVGVFAVVLFVAVGFGSYGGLPAPESILSRFGIHAQSERFVRGLVVLTIAAVAVVSRLAQRARASEKLPTPEQIDRALVAVRAYGRSTSPLLVATGDKYLLHDGDPAEGFVAYDSAGPYLVAYADPVCPSGGEKPLLAALLERAADLDRDVVLYQISPGLLPLAHDFGFSFFKLGEEGIVDLARFDLRGNKAKSWRSAVNGVERAGGRIEILAGEELRPVLPELRRVSDDWLASKHGSEKGFSLGKFDEAYLLRFPCAVVRRADETVIAFANLLEGAQGEELSVDLMRHTSEGEEDDLGDVMDYLLIQLMLHGKERGFARFNLGMAPLSAVGEERSARPLEKLAHLFFRHGDPWYNYRGIRRFKEKFDPAWEPRYMAYPRPWDWPLAVANTAVLISGGWRSLLLPGRGTR